MKNKTQLERYKLLTDYIDEYYKEDIDIEKVESICHYSYRNINRIFFALHGETIGKYIKRVRLEKAAQYLKFSNQKITEIAFEVGFENASAFNKAFRNKFDISPKNFRNRVKGNDNLVADSFNEIEPLEFSVEFLPDFYFLYLGYRGIYSDNIAVSKTWENLLSFCEKEGLITSKTVFLAELVDDNEISDSIHFRYNCAVKIEKPLKHKPAGLFKTKQHNRKKYVKFNHYGSYETSIETYKRIYAFWFKGIQLEFRDAPVIEIYPNFTNPVPEEQQRIEIYIPIM